MLHVDYRPRNPKHYDPRIGLIGCGGITEYHLRAYRDAGFRVVALCDVNEQAARSRAAEFFPEATVYTDHRDLLRHDDIEIVDIATHPPQRPPIIRDALQAHKHVLSQKPFVLDLDVGQALVDLAEQQGVKLAVNQNGRWAPHFSYLRSAVAAGLLGDLSGIHMSVHWDHTWTEGTEFERIQHLILYDFAIHWFDMVNCLLSDQTPRRVFAATARSKRQTLKPPLLAQAMIEYPHAQASLAFDADTSVGPNDRVYVAGSQGSFHSNGKSYQSVSATLTAMTDEGEQTCAPKLQGQWFPDGFHGTMGELLCSIEEDRTPSIDARRNLQSLSLCFAAVASAESGEPIVPGSVRKLPS